MASLVRAARSMAVVARPAFRATTSRGVAIKIMEEGKAKENFYWAQEDEKLLRKMIENNPELDPAFAGAASGDSAVDSVKMVFIKHGIPPVNKKLIGDLVKLIEKSQ